MSKIGVVIPAYNASKTILSCLESLNDQTFNQKNYVVYFVDDGSTDDTMKLVKHYALGCRYKIILLPQANSGPGIARNHALKIAKEQLIAFTDADCIPDGDWLASINEEFKDRNGNLLGGQVYCNESVIYPWRMSPAGQIRITANFAVRKSALNGIYFDEQFKGLVGNDTDFINRLEESNRKNVYIYSKDVKVQHPLTILTTSDVIRKAKSRHNENLLYKIYGKRIMSSMHYLFRPYIFGHISILAVLSIVTFCVIVGLFVFVHALWVFLLLGLVVTGFMLFGYKLLVKNHHDFINFKLRVQTLYLFIVYVTVYLLARIRGSIMHRYLLI